MVVTGSGRASDKPYNIGAEKNYQYYLGGFLMIIIVYWAQNLILI